MTAREHDLHESQLHLAVTLGQHGKPQSDDCTHCGSVQCSHDDRPCLAGARARAHPLRKGDELSTSHTSTLARGRLVLHSLVGPRDGWIRWCHRKSIVAELLSADSGQINSFYSLPSFKEKFGDEKHGVKSIPTNWQTAYQTIGIPGSFIGLFLCGWCQERFGSRRTYMSGMAACICVVFLFVFAQSKGMLLGTEAIAAGIWSLFSECSPRAHNRQAADLRHPHSCLRRRGLPDSTSRLRDVVHLVLLGIG